MVGTTQSALPNRNPIGLFANLESAESARQALQEAGFARDRISLVPRSLDPNPPVRDTEAKNSAGPGALMGTAFGAIGGLMVGYVSLVLPNTPIVHVSSVVALVLAGSGIGAAMGGLIGAVTGTYVHKAEAEPENYGEMAQQYLMFVEGDQETQLRAKAVIKQPEQPGVEQIP